MPQAMRSIGDVRMLDVPEHLRGNKTQFLS